MNKHLFAISCCVFLQTCVEAQKTCLTPDRQSGKCIPLRDCGHLFQLLVTVPLTSETRNFLSRSQCDYQNSTPYVCCVQSQAAATNSNVFNGTLGLNKTELPLPGKCGHHVDMRIFSENATGIYQFPWMALLEYAKPDGDRGFHCGGVLIHKNYVLTASHCVKGMAILKTGYRLVSVRLGEWDRFFDSDCDDWDVCAPKPQDIAVTEQIPHESYQSSSQTEENDIALLRLERSVIFTDFIRPICLPLEDSIREVNFDERRASNVVGWGLTHTASQNNLKLMSEVHGVPLDQCNRAYNMQNTSIGPMQVCASSAKIGNICIADPGGPLVTEITTNGDPIFYLVGVLSFSPKECGVEDWPDVYTRATSYTDWILSHMHP